MQTTLNWTDPITGLTGLALLSLSLVQVWLITRNRSLSAGRKWVRAGLNFLLWLVVTGYFLHISWPITRPATHALLIGEDVPSAFVRKLNDSLPIQVRLSSRDFKADYDSVTLVGQSFPTETLTQLSSANVQWVPYNPPDQVQALRWKGIVRQGEMQLVVGGIHSSKAQLLRLRFGSQTVDSVALSEGPNTFTLQFPTFSRDRSQTELVLGESTLDTLRFFVRPTESLTVQFLLNSPDFESKTLADWLGKQGHRVNISAALSKNISSNISINQVNKSAGQPMPDLIITEPVNAASSAVRKAVAGGKAVLFLNLTNPETDCRAINQALGSGWQVRKIAGEPLIPIKNGLNALPYRFVERLNQFAVSGYPVAVQQTTGQVGVSLLSETFPLSLSGDSLGYNRVWMAVLARFARSNKTIVQVDAPVYTRIRQSVSINNASGRQRTLQIGPDTVPLTYSSINERSALANSLFRQPGWQIVQDSLALYVNALRPNDPVANRAMVSRFMQVHSRYPSARNQSRRTATAQLPDWAWLVLLIGCFTALWVEPKLP
ncbi:hypothetical protein [Spirosoma areae]